MNSKRGPSWLEMVRAKRRLGALVCKRHNALIFDRPGPTVADEQQAKQDEALIAEWQRRNGYAPPPPSLALQDPIIRSGPRRRGVSVHDDRGRGAAACSEGFQVCDCDTVFSFTPQ